MAVDPARVKTLFLNASDLADPAERAAYLDRECGDDAELRGRVEALLAADGPPGPGPEPGATAVFDPSPVGPLEATRLAASETVPGSRVSGPDGGLATVGATEAGGEADTLADGPSAARPGPFVPGRVIGGRYTLLEVLGEGGMGTVYRAEQSQPVRRMVALKLIKVGMDSRTVLARFDAERQALAMMDHPNIARVYDGGATDAGQPFFVMEFVRGVPITDYCDRHRLSVDARLELFVAACQAVQHAHQKGIIHRDLKPSNVMVTEVDGRPTPKVIDFGVAKATEATLTDQSLGDTGAIVGTPTYMSPEQADPSSMDVDTRTDVYALGVILYELLAGSPPLDATQFRRGAILEMLRMVREVDPARPSTKVSTADALPSIAANRGIDPERLKRELRGDLDWIVMKALEKDRTRRYETANGLGADILRHLASEPVLAAPPSRSYRLRKFARKHRAGVVAASLVVLALVAGMAGTTAGLFEARRQETLANERAEGERRAKLDAQEKKMLAEANEKKAVAAAEGERQAKETAEAVLGFVESKVFAAARPQGQDGGLGYEVKLADAVTAALPAIEQGFVGKPLVEARLRTTIGRSFLYLGKPDLAAGQFAAARSLNTNHLGPDHPDTLASMFDLATSYAGLGRLAEALKLHGETLALRRARLGPDHPGTLRSMSNMAATYAALGRLAEALKLHEETLALRQARLGPDHPDTLVSRNDLASSYGKLGRLAEALKLHEETVTLQKAKLGPDHPDSLRSMSNLANIYTLLGRLAEALKLREETLALSKAKLGPDHPGTLISMSNLAINYARLGRQAEALKFFEETLALRKAKLGPDHPDTLVSRNNLVVIYDELGRHAEALKLVQEALALSKAKLGPDHPDTLRSMRSLADTYSALGRHAEALKLREEVLSLVKDKVGADRPDMLEYRRDLGNALIAVGRTTEGLPLLDEFATAHPEDPYNSLKTAVLWGWLGREAEYAATRRRVLAAARGSDDATLWERAARLSSVLPSSDRAEIDAALALARRAIKPGDKTAGRFDRRLALGMAAYRAGDDPACDEALRGVEEAGEDFPLVTGTAAFFRAMSLHRRGRVDEARRIATEAAARVTLPGDETNPLTGNTNPDLLVRWLAYKEAKALIGFDAPPVAPPRPDGK